MDRPYNLSCRARHTLGWYEVVLSRWMKHRVVIGFCFEQDGIGFLRNCVFHIGDDAALKGGGTPQLCWLCLFRQQSSACLCWRITMNGYMIVQTTFQWLLLPKNRCTKKCTSHLF